MASELESDLRDTDVTGFRKWLVDFNARKTQLVLYDQSNNSVAIDVKIDGSALEEKSYFKILGCLSLLNWVGTLTLSLLFKLPPRKLES